MGYRRHSDGRSACGPRKVAVTGRVCASAAGAGRGACIRARGIVHIPRTVYIKWRLRKSSGLPRWDEQIDCTKFIFRTQLSITIAVTKNNKN